MIALQKILGSTHIVALKRVVCIAWDGRGKTIDARRVTQLRVLSTVQQARCQLRVPLRLDHVRCAHSDTSSPDKLTFLAAMLCA